VALLASGCTGLQLLDLSWCLELGDGALAAIGQHLQGLRQLWLTRCVKWVAHAVCMLCACCVLCTAAMHVSLCLLFVALMPRGGMITPCEHACLSCGLPADK
jgi:hypothetical protein